MYRLRPQILQVFLCVVCRIISESLTSNPKIVQRAEEVADKFKLLNLKYSKVHIAVSHSRHGTDSDIPQIQSDIMDYVQLFRKHYPHKVYPKLHLLENHTVTWIQSYGFGMGLMGEQGGESTHKTFNQLQRRYRGMSDPVRRIGSMIRSHLTSTHPCINQSIIPSVKRRKLSSDV